LLAGAQAEQFRASQAQIFSQPRWPTTETLSKLRRQHWIVVDATQQPTQLPNLRRGSISHSAIACSHKMCEHTSICPVL